MKRAVFWVLVMVAAGVVLAPVTVGVVKRLKDKSPPGTSRKDREKAVEYLDSLYQRYLREDVQGARAAMIEAAVYSRKSPIPELKQSLILCYSRLSVLEERAGNTNAADIFYEKAKRMTGNPADFTRDDCRRIVTHWDETYTKQTGPKYLQILNQATNKTDSPGP